MGSPHGGLSKSRSKHTQTHTVMARMNRILVLTLILTVICSRVATCSAKKPVGMARKEDIPYIKCQVCQKIAHQLYNQVQTKKAQISPKKISEYQVIEIAENVCNLKKREADWILRIDIVEQGDRLELVEQDSEGQCNSECKTIERACQEVLGDYDTDVAEFLYNKKPQVDSLVNFLCSDRTKACSKKPPPVPKDRIAGEPFSPKSEKEAEMEKMLKSMEGMPGAPGMKMYSREDLMNMKNFGDEDADEEDDDEEANFPSKLGKVLREKESKSDWKQTLTKGLKGTSMALKKHAYRVSHRILQWWKGKKGSFKKSKNGKAEL